MFDHVCLPYPSHGDPPYQQCTNENFHYHGKCYPNEPIPTVSEWGLVATTLLVMTIGTLIFTRRKRATVAVR